MCSTGCHRNGININNKRIAIDKNKHVEGIYIFSENITKEIPLIYLITSCFKQSEKQ